MSLTRTLSIKTKSQLESDEETLTEFILKRKGAFPDADAQETLREVNATQLHNSEITKTNGHCNGNAVSQYTENTDAQIDELKTELDNNVTIDSAIKATVADPAPTQTEDNQSFAIPEGLVMDPLAPTALAVSSEFMDRIGSGLTLLRDHGKKVQKYVLKNRKFDILKKSWKSIVNVVLIDAKDLPDVPVGNVYCKFKLGNETHKSKQVSKSKPTWCERFNLYLYEDSALEVTVWHKGKQKNFMGRCMIDVCQLEKEKTLDVWQELECGYGSLHLLVTVSGTARSVTMDNVPTTTGAHVPPPSEDYSWYRLRDLNEVGQLSVTVHGARGLSALGIGKADAYCVLELGNSRVQTHVMPGTSEPVWNKNYTFSVNDVTSTLDLTIYDDSLINHEHLGRVSIPLLRIENDEKRWYALKDRSKKSSAKGNCPRICLQMSLAWNPVKASLRVLSPKEEKYTEKTVNKFNIPLIYNNLQFIRDIFQAVYVGNEHFKYLFEWENREVSALALIGWLSFWFFFRMWMTPMLLVVPFLYYWMSSHGNTLNALVSVQSSSEEEEVEDDIESTKDEKTLKTRLYGLQDLTLTIKNGIDYICSLIERVKNLANFSVPYLSYLAMAALLALTAALYFIPVNYLFMAFGIYKFTRKWLIPDRVPNNDILDFISRVPDDKILKEWRELKVPEPSVSRSGSQKRR